MSTFNQSNKVQAAAYLAACDCIPPDALVKSMASFFRSNVKLYGPGGIGGCQSLGEFEDIHQKTRLAEFPDRRVGNLDNLIAERDLVGASSLPRVHATHTAPYFGPAASGKPLSVNENDVWRQDGDMFTENWVFVDLPHLSGQIGTDLMAKILELETK